LSNSLFHHDDTVNKFSWGIYVFEGHQSMRQIYTSDHRIIKSQYY